MTKREIKGIQIKILPELVPTPQVAMISPRIRCMKFLITLTHIHTFFPFNFCPPSVTRLTARAAEPHGFPTEMSSSASSFLVGLVGNQGKGPASLSFPL